MAYALQITDLDPIRYDLLFERFLNPERVSLPDFDIDFCMDGRDRVIDYVAQKYGRERVSQIITYGTMAAKAVVRDVGRVLGMAYGFVDRIAKLIPFELGITLDAALEKEPELKRLYQAEEEVKNLIDLARSLEGLTRNAGMHAGGVVIAPSVLTDFAPLYCDAGGGSVVTQFDKDDVEAAGLVKFDFLGLRTLTIIDRAAALINRERPAGSAPLTVSTLPMNDAPTYALLKSCRTTAVFQLESRGMKDLIRRLQPDRFEDIVALVALFRPGPLQSGMVDDFINRKHAPHDARIDYLHPSLEAILKPTYGVILYQEQVMQVAQVLAGYTLGGADLLRKAMGKKKPEEMAQQRSVFVDGAVARGVREYTAGHIFDLMEKFAGYGFNKSHSAAYALLSYQTAYLKAHYPAQFMAAVLSADMDHTDKVVTLIQECSDMGLKVLSPDVNASGYEFTACGTDSIRYGLGAVRGVGRGAVEAIIAGREAHGPYGSLADLCRRLDLQKVNRRVLEALLRAGSLDGLGANRATLMDRLSAAMQLGDQNTRAHAAGQNDLFGLAADERGSALEPQRATPLPEWSEAVRLAGERETLGLYLTGHPLARFESGLEHFVSHRIGELVSDRPLAGLEAPRFGGGKPVTVAGLIDEVKKRGPRVILTLDDRTGRIEAVLFEETWHKHRELIAKDALVLVEGLLRFDEFSDAWRLSVRRISELDEVRSRAAQRLLIRCAHADLARGLERLAAILAPWRPGPCPITVEYCGQTASGALSLGSEWTVRPTRELLEQLAGLVGARRRAGASTGPVRAACPPPLRMGADGLLAAPAAPGRSTVTSRSFRIRAKYATWPLPSWISNNPSPSSKRRSRSSGTSPRTPRSTSRTRSTGCRPRAGSSPRASSPVSRPGRSPQLARHPQRPYTLDYVHVHLQRLPRAARRPDVRRRRWPSSAAWRARRARRHDHRPPEGPRHQGARAAQLRHAEAGGLSQGAAADAARRAIRFAAGDAHRHQGAYPGVGAEERGQSEAIARNLFEMSVLSVPIVTVVTGEGGSGGALGIGVCDRLLMLQYSTYSVISPEGCASILWKSQDKKEVAAEALNLTADRLQKLGLVDEVIEEPLGGAHRDPVAVAASLKAALIRQLDELEAIPRDQLRAERATKIAGFGVFAENAA